MRKELREYSKKREHDGGKPRHYYIRTSTARRAVNPSCIVVTPATGVIAPPAGVTIIHG